MNKRACEEHLAVERQLEEERRLRPGTPGFESVTVESLPLSEEEFDFSTMPTLEDYLEVEHTLSEEPVAQPQQESKLVTPRQSRPATPRGAESGPSTTLPIEQVIDLEQLATALSSLDTNIEEGEIPSTDMPVIPSVILPRTTALKSIVKLPLSLIHI